MSSELPSSAQIRAARGLLDWSQEKLASESGLSRRTLASIELGKAGSEASLLALKGALEAQGIAFTGAGEDEGVRRGKTP